MSVARQACDCPAAPPSAPMRASARPSGSVCLRSRPRTRRAASDTRRQPSTCVLACFLASRAPSRAGRWSARPRWCAGHPQPVVGSCAVGQPRRRLALGGSHGQGAGLLARPRAWACAFMRRWMERRPALEAASTLAVPSLAGSSPRMRLLPPVERVTGTGHARLADSPCPLQSRPCKDTTMHLRYHHASPCRHSRHLIHSAPRLSP